METNIYDTHNRPRIYLADDGDQSFCTWNGHAVACGALVLLIAYRVVVRGAPA